MCCRCPKRKDFLECRVPVQACHALIITTIIASVKLYSEIYALKYENKPHKGDYSELIEKAHYTLVVAAGAFFNAVIIMVRDRFRECLSKEHNCLRCCTCKWYTLLKFYRFHITAGLTFIVLNVFDNPYVVGFLSGCIKSAAVEVLFYTQSPVSFGVSTIIINMASMPLETQIFGRGPLPDDMKWIAMVVSTLCCVVSIAYIHCFGRSFYLKQTDSKTDSSKQDCCHLWHEIGTEDDTKCSKSCKIIYLVPKLIFVIAVGIYLDKMLAKLLDIGHDLKLTKDQLNRDLILPQAYIGLMIMFGAIASNLHTEESAYNFHQILGILAFAVCSGIVLHLENYKISKNIYRGISITYLLACHFTSFLEAAVEIVAARFSKNHYGLFNALMTTISSVISVGLMYLLAKEPYSDYYVLGAITFLGFACQIIKCCFIDKMDDEQDKLDKKYTRCAQKCCCCLK